MVDHFWSGWIVVAGAKVPQKGRGCSNGGGGRGKRRHSYRFSQVLEHWTKGSLHIWVCLHFGAEEEQEGEIFEAFCEMNIQPELQATTSKAKHQNWPNEKGTLWDFCLFWQGGRLTFGCKLCGKRMDSQSKAKMFHLTSVQIWSSRVVVRQRNTSLTTMLWNSRPLCGFQVTKQKWLKIERNIFREQNVSMMK